MGRFTRTMRALSTVAFVAALCTGASSIHAQATGTIRGTVTGGTQTPLSGVQVSVAGTQRSAVTGSNGEYVIANVPAGARTVRAVLMGHTAVDRTVTLGAGETATVDFHLSPSAVALEGLVVTALGITQQERAVSTSVQQIEGDELNRARDPNLVTALSGKVSGVQITNSNTAGGSARIVIRGASSLTGNNQPLFVVDGIPVSNVSSQSGTRGYNALDYGNAIQDINPADIASISVLKGPNAAALYGSRAANGAILITTKSGRSAQGTTVSASSQVTFETPLKLPTYQNSYGQGWNGRYAYKDGKGGGTFDDYDESWGPRLDGQMIPQFFSNGQPAPWVANPNNVRDFFETGRTANTSVAFATRSDHAGVRLSIANLNQDGAYPGFRQERTTVALNGGGDLGERLRIDGSFQYINADAENRPAQGYGEDNVMWQFLWFGRQVDTRMLKNRLRNDDGSQFNWNNRWNNNPYWTTQVNRNWDARDRVIGSGSLAFDVAPWLTATVRSGTDWSQENRKKTWEAGTRGISGVNGAFDEANVFRQETNTDFLLSGRWDRQGAWSLTTNFGGNRRDNDYRSNAVSVQDVVVPSLFDLGNAAVTPALADWRERERVNSLYGAAQVGFRNYLFVDVTGRNDWSSTLPESNRSFFYPSVSSSFVFTDAFPGFAAGFLSFGKLRAGWAEVGNDTQPYQLVDPYIADAPFNGIPRFTASNRLRNFDLKPEITRAWEAGTELRFLDNRLGVELTYYDKSTSNQIIPVQITPLTGFTARMLNAGTISNRGIELLVDATPVSLDNGFRWNVVGTFSRNRNRVDELFGDLETIVLDTYYGVSVEARKGEAYGAMYGRKYVRDSKGNIVVGSNGLPLNNSSNPNGYLGNYHPDWTGGLSNRLSYGNVDLSFLLDARRGGSIYSMTNRYGRRSGVLIETLQGRENTPFDSMVVPGVRVVNGDTVPNTRKVLAQSYHRGLSGIAEEFVYDASFVKLREVRLGYQVPSAWSGRMRLDGLTVALVGRNLALWSDVPNIDPETAFNAGNAQGFEYSQMPSLRSIGLSLTVTP
ncbi:MAG TPA: SusC/RagA family TonB-linked outer membrane protein [Longimicrobiaceae bacterium]|nr:SusC/RagA family TonB-linked outer membrane protein [Longimicrobiaceae bacterium]